MTDNDDAGMSALAGTMTSGAFACLLHLLNWAKVWQRLHEGGAEMDADTAHCMMIPFTGIGADPDSWMRYGPQVIGMIMNEITKWSADEAYRAANTMPWCILSVAGPGLSMASKDMQHSMEAHRIVGEYFTIGESPNVPSLSTIIERAKGKSPDAGSSEVATKRPAQPAAPARSRGPNQTSARASNRSDAYAALGGNPRRPVR